MKRYLYMSGLNRVMHCQGSHCFDLPRPEAGEAAKEGTAAAELLDLMLKGAPIPTEDTRYGIFFDNEMRAFCQRVADRIKSDANGAEVRSEVTVNWMTNSGMELKGRYDASFVMGDSLYVDDFKYGHSIVEPENNWQLIAYAIGEVIRTQRVYDQIVLRIHQPRPHHERGWTREWVIPYSELLEYKAEIEEVSRILMDPSLKPEVSTSAACKYCPAAAEACTAFNKAFYRGVEVVEEFFQDSITNEELAFQISLIDRIEDILKTKRDSIRELAVSRINRGDIVPGYSTVESHGHRKWNAGLDPEFIKMMTGKDIVSKSMLSPAKAEALGIDKKFVESFTSRPFLGMKLKKENASAMADKIFGKPQTMKEVENVNG